MKKYYMALILLCAIFLHSSTYSMDFYRAMQAGTADNIFAITRNKSESDQDAEVEHARR